MVSFVAGQTLLVFPVDVDSVTPIVRTAAMLGVRVVAASSVTPLRPVDGCDECIYLPYISDDGFDEALRRAMRAHNVTQLVTMHVGVWAHFARLAETDGEVRAAFRGTHPVQQQWQVFAPSLSWARRQQADDIATGLTVPGGHVAPPLSVAEYASLHRGFHRTYGQCDVAKLEALCAILRVTPPGEVVELGVFFGRSAYALARLAHAHGVGSTICVDSWGRASITDQGAAAGVLNVAQSAYNQEHVFEEFLALASEVPSMSYIRQEAVDAVLAYRDAARHGVLTVPELREVAVSGAIALLHVDANHRYDQVRRDVEAWEPLVRPGGWIVFDDYDWTFGDGPKRVGDELLATGRFERAFVWSDSLFMRKRGS
ncbi:MAG: class I SAM-dependent methyltransferase [Gemmatimonas sp.]|nr:class I SAM-dependent methyltransferase [Gemmatimonas sp.]